MIRWTVLRRPLLSLLMLLLSSTGYQVLRGPSAAPRLSLEMTWDRSHTAPGEAVALVATVRGIDLTAPLTTTLTIRLPGGTTLVEQLDTYALTCTPMTASLTCTGPLGVASPQSAAVRLLVGDHRAGTALVVSAVAVAGNGVTAAANDTLFVQAAAPTAAPVTPTSITTPTLTPTVTLPATVPATGVIPTATVPALPTDGVPTMTLVPSVTPTPVTPSVTPLPSQTPRPTVATPTLPAPTVPPHWGPDALENNYDRTHASLLAVGEVYADLTLVAPGGDGLGDVDYVEWFAKVGRCYILETRDLAPGLDTNIEILDAADQVVAGNDDATPLDPRSQVTVCPDQDTMVVARIAQNTKAPLPDPRGKTYALVVTATLPATATPAPTSIPATTIPATSVPVISPPAVPTVPALPLPKQPTLPAVDGTDLPPLDVTLPGGVGISVGGAEPTPSGPTAIPCQPFLDQAAVVTDTAIFAAPESCEQVLAIETLPMPTGQVRVAAIHAALYAGPGAQYARLALLPRAYPLTLTGLTRNGWVAVAIQTSGDVPPLSGWAWGASLRVVQWDSLASMPTPTAPLVAGGPTPALPTNAPVGSGTLVGGGTPLTIKPRPATTRTVVVQVCRDGGAAAATACVPASGVGGVRLQILSAAGDVVATGLTDADGRWSTRLPPASGLRVVAPLLGLAGPVALDRAADPLVVALSLPAAVIPPAFR